MNYVLLRKLYPTTSNTDIAVILGTTKNNVAQRAKVLGLKKNPVYLSGVNRKNGLKGLKSQKVV